MTKRIVFGVLVAVVVAIGFAVSAYAEGDDFIMGCASLWPFC